MHDLGRTLLAVSAGKDFSKADPLNFEEDDATLSKERTILETDHAAFGAWFIRNSKLPETLVEVALCHHRCESASG